MLIADFGTTYTKILDLEATNANPRIITSKELPPDLWVEAATGHNGKRRCHHYINELTALARGGAEIINESDYVLLDCGSRDSKFIQVKDHKVVDMGWNAECGASMGFTIELLGHYYQVDFSKLSVPTQTFNVVCGVLGMSHIFDAITSGASAHEAVARFVKGIAINAYRFAGSPPKIYLSGGLCANPLFIKSLPAETISLGRGVLLKGVAAAMASRQQQTTHEQ